MSKLRVVWCHRNAGANAETGPDRGAGAEDKRTAHWWESLQCTQLTRVGALMGLMSSGRIRVFSDDPGHGVGISRRGTRPDTETHVEAKASNAEKETRKK